jgi:UPF0755 protein
MTKKNKKIITIACFSFLILAVAVFVWEGVFLPKTPQSQETKIFSVVSGEGTKEISVNLKNQGLIKYGLLFRFYTLTIGVAQKLQAGDYLLSPSMNMAEITKKMAKGDVIKQEITIIEGWDLRDISFYLQEQGIVEAKDFSTAANLANDYVQDFGFLKDKPETLSLEGYLFPDTYQIKKGETSEEIIIQILENFDKKLTPELKQEIKQQNKSIFEIITMASLIEKEVKTLPDKKLVSGVLWKRLENDFPLQVDATISYITGKKNAKVLIADTKIDSPFNTYKYAGLPLGPISNPGLESIVSAVYPESSKFWYYLSTPEGETIFSKTLEEHNIARAKYLK